jgi:hypothetical protein
MIIEQIVTTLVFLVVAFAFLQPSAPRFFAAVSFVSITLLHELLLSDYVGLMYYGSAALFDLGIIILTSGISPVPKMVLTLHKICMVSILANLAGWLMWFLYYPPLAYDAAFAIIYAWTLITLINRDSLDVGGYTLDSWASCFRFDSSPWALYISKHTGKL